MRADKNAAMIDRFKRIAPVYFLVTPFLFRTWNRMAALAGLTPADSALDVAGGTGSLAARLIKRAARVTLVDLSPAMLSRAVKRLRGTGAAVTQADATSLPFPDDAFDVSFISIALHEVPPPDAVAILKEMARVTRRAIVAADFAVPRTRLGLWTLKNTIGLVEEPTFFDFLEVGLPGLAARAGLTVAASQRPWLGGTEIILVQLADGETTARRAAAAQ